MNRSLALLDLVGRYGTQGFAVSIFLGLALPCAAAFARTAAYDAAIASYFAQHLLFPSPLWGGLGWGSIVER